ncbi:hypothetical protein AX14_002689 [Amanita brunnescens Koide BX004]|nr:hypothetical protein AX14_002689 [Amanita brunnescens Koide BX004]
MGLYPEAISIVFNGFLLQLCAFEVPFLKRLCPSIWLSILVLFWGIMMTLQGLCSESPRLICTRGELLPLLLV